MNCELESFFVFNPSFGPKEGEEEKKILYYHPVGTDQNKKSNSVGLCEAVIQFCLTFTKEPCKTIHTQKFRQVFYEPEPKYYLVMILSVPSVVTNVPNGGMNSDSKQGGDTTSSVQVEYKDENLQDSVCNAVLIQVYQMFTLFNGRFESIILKYGVDGLRLRLEHFFNQYIINLTSFDSYDLLNVYNGVQFLPLDGATFLRVQSQVNQLEFAFTDNYISYTLFFYDNKLIWCGLNPDDLRILYRYLTSHLFVSRSATAPTLHSPVAAGFIAGPPDLTDSTNMGKIPRIFLMNTTNNNEERDYHLVCYRVSKAVVCLLIEGSKPVTFEVCQTIDQLFRVKFSQLSDEIQRMRYHQTSSPTLSDNQVRYIYYNHMNMAQKSSIHPDHVPPLPSALCPPALSSLPSFSTTLHVSGSGISLSDAGTKDGGSRRTSSASGATVPASCMRLATDIHDELTFCGDHVELLAKTANDFWVFGKLSDTREFVAVVTEKNSSMIHANDEIKKLCDSQFNGLFFID